MIMNINSFKIISALYGNMRKHFTSILDALEANLVLTKSQSINVT